MRKNNEPGHDPRSGDRGSWPGVIRLLLALLALVPLAGCGRAGPPRVPGPKEQIIYPRAYPKPDPSPLPPGTMPPAQR